MKTGVKIDVIVPTYQSERYLDACLSSIRRTVPVNNLIVIDHYSTDRTIEIAKKHGAKIYFENIGLAYARQLGIELASTPIFLMVDSDVVFFEENWFERAYRVMEEDPRVGALGLWTPSRYPDWRQKYINFWWRTVPASRKLGFVNAYMIRKKAVEGIKIPRFLNAHEHYYIKLYIKRRGYKIKVIPVKGMHYYDHAEGKAAWLGAGNRVLFGVDPVFKLLLYKIFPAPLKAFFPALAYRDPMIIVKNTRHWLDFLRGWLKPMEHIQLKRK